MRSRPALLLTTFLLALLVAAPRLAGAQGGAPLSEQMGIGGGPYYSMQQISLPGMDTRLASMGLEGMPEWFESWGGSGSVQVGHLLLGGGSWSGSATRSAVVSGIARETRVDIASGGFTAGYVKTAGRMKLTVGATLGGGSIEVTARRSPTAAPTWDGVWQYYESGFTGTVDAADLDVSTSMTADYFTAQPFLSIRYRVWFFLHADVGAYYNFAKVGAGKLKADGRTIPDAPALDLSGLGMRLGIYIGF